MNPKTLSLNYVIMEFLFVPHLCGDEMHKAGGKA